MLDTVLENRFSSQRPSLLATTLILSGVFHILLLMLELPYKTRFFTQPTVTPSVPIEITELPPELLYPEQKKTIAKKEIEIAETEDAESRKLDPNATILSDRTQTAKQQTRAQTIDDFRAKQGTGLKLDRSKPIGGLAPSGELGKVDSLSKVEIDDGLGITAEAENLGIKRDWKTLSLRDLSVPGNGLPNGATDDRLAAVSPGDRTILSTREFRYFSYYHRIKELLRQHWKPTVERKLTMLWARGKNLKKNEMTTKLLVLLDTKGGLQKISRVASSGVEVVDTAAEEAFKKASPFPNPPRGLVDPDGFVRIRWDFILKAEGAPRIRFQRSPAGRRPIP